ncbi:hypothetical protein STEG23_024309 [Scotinomys teguina]
MKFTGKWKELENIILSEVTQTQKVTHDAPSLGGVPHEHYPSINISILSICRSTEPHLLSGSLCQFAKPKTKVPAKLCSTEGGPFLVPIEDEDCDSLQKTSVKEVKEGIFHNPFISVLFLEKLTLFFVSMVGPQDDQENENFQF